LTRLTIDRNEFIQELAQSGVGSSVHWRPLHLHPYYQESFGWLPEDCPVATETWARLVSLPLFPGMREEEIEHVIHTVKLLCARYARLKTSSK
jgi:perosamine synthetase